MIDTIIIIGEIGILVSGVLTLAAGTFRVSGTKTTRGWQVRVGALAGILPILGIALAALLNGSANEEGFAYLVKQLTDPGNLIFVGAGFAIGLILFRTAPAIPPEAPHG